MSAHGKITVERLEILISTLAQLTADLDEAMERIEVPKTEGKAKKEV